MRLIHIFMHKFRYIAQLFLLLFNHEGLIIVDSVLMRINSVRIISSFLFWNVTRKSESSSVLMLLWLIVWYKVIPHLIERCTFFVLFVSFVLSFVKLKPVYNCVSIEKGDGLLFQAEVTWLCNKAACWRHSIVLGCWLRKPTQKLSMPFHPSAWLSFSWALSYELNEKEPISRVYC